MDGTLESLSRQRLRGALTGLLVVALAAACAGQQSTLPGSTTEIPGSAEGSRDNGAVTEGQGNGQGVQLMASHDPDLERDVERIRAATVAFKSLEAAVAAGYQEHVQHCLENPPAGGMGYHHTNPDLMDDTIELERPEILVYERTASGDYELTGVEYVVPLAQWTDAQPPTVMGQNLKRSTQLGIWYLHVWIWRPNSSGLFADWNPSVTCRG